MSNFNRMVLKQWLGALLKQELTRENEIARIIYAIDYLTVSGDHAQ